MVLQCCYSVVTEMLLQGYSGFTSVSQWCDGTRSRWSCASPSSLDSVRMSARTHTHAHAHAQIHTYTHTVPDNIGFVPPLQF
jgi:hypothetical protein